MSPTCNAALQGPSPSSPSLCLWEGARSRLLAHPPRVALGKQADSGVDVTVDRLYVMISVVETIDMIVEN